MKFRIGIKAEPFLLMCANQTNTPHEDYFQWSIDRNPQLVVTMLGSNSQPTI
jgi:hypothetical protein